jgi:exodeoxyribonuclease VII small subunit
MPKAKPDKSYQELKSELDDVMLALQDEDIGVDEALGYYQRGLELLQAIEAYLKTAENKVTELKTKFKDTA